VRRLLTEPTLKKVLQEKKRRVGWTWRAFQKLQGPRKGPTMTMKLVEA
jgi:hypothetical protein